MKTRTINISLMPELIERIDAQAALDYATRSEYIRRAIIERLRVDEVITDIGVEEVTRAANRRRLKKYLEEQLKETREQR